MRLHRAYAVYENDVLFGGVQRRTTKMVPGIKKDDYANGLKKLVLPSHANRGKREHFEFYPVWNVFFILRLSYGLLSRNLYKFKFAKLS